ncbi:MAG: hypothetical protein JW904_06300 [Spirochaetales bacterium]|nr:hypothetical protein [Spirochaetales bacterium]
MKKKLLIVVLLFVFGAVYSFACEMTFFLDGKQVVPGQTLSLDQGRSYELRVNFVEDHGNCPVEPEETAFLLAEEKWKTTKTALPLVLTRNVVWTDISDREHETVLVFTAQQTGKTTLEVIRDCTKKAGYDEIFYITVK